MFCIFLGKSNLSVQLGLTEHNKHLQCRSTEEMWNLYTISFLPSIMHCIVKTLWVDMELCRCYLQLCILSVFNI